MNEEYKQYIDKLVAKGKDESAVINFMYGLGYKNQNEYLPYYNEIKKKEDSVYEAISQEGDSGYPLPQEDQGGSSVTSPTDTPSIGFSVDQNWLTSIKEQAFIDWSTGRYNYLAEQGQGKGVQIKDFNLNYGFDEVEGEQVYNYALSSYDDIMEQFVDMKPKTANIKERVVASPKQLDSFAPPRTEVEIESLEDVRKRLRQEEERSYRDKVKQYIIDSLPPEIKNNPEALKDLELSMRNSLLEEFDLTGENDIGNKSFGEQLGLKFMSGFYDAVSGVANLISMGSNPLGIPNAQAMAATPMAAAKADEIRAKQNTHERNITESLSNKDFASAAKQMAEATSESAPLMMTAIGTSMATGNPMTGAMIVSSIATSSEEFRTRGDENFYYYVNEETGDEISYEEGNKRAFMGGLDGYELKRDDLARGTYLGSVFATELLSEYFTSKIGLSAMADDFAGKPAKSVLKGYLTGMGVSVPEEALPEMLAHIGSQATYDLTTKGEMRGAKVYLEEGIEVFLASAASGPAMRFAPSTYQASRALATDLMGRANKYTNLPVNLDPKVIEGIKNQTISDAEAKQEMGEFFEYTRKQKLENESKDAAFYRHIGRQSESDLQELANISALYTHNKRQHDKAKTEAEKQKYQERMSNLEARRDQIESKYADSYAASLENTVYEKAISHLRELLAELTAIDDMIARLKTAEDTEFYDEAEVEVQRMLREMLVDRIADLQGYIARVEDAGDSYGTELFDEEGYTNAFEELGAFLGVPVKLSRERKAPEAKTTPTPKSTPTKPVGLWSSSEQLKNHNEDQQNRGSTFGMNGESQTGKGMVAVSVFPDLGRVEEDELTQEHLDEFYEANKELLEANKDVLSIGTWTNPEDGKTYIDISVVVPKEDGVRLGQEYNQKAVYDLDENKEIDTGGTGEFVDGLPSVEQRIADVKEILNKKTQQTSPTPSPVKNKKSPSPAYKGGGVRTFGKFGAAKAKLANRLLSAFSAINPNLSVVIHRDQQSMMEASSEAKAVIDSGEHVNAFIEGDTIHLMDTASNLDIIEEFLHSMRSVFADPATRKKLVDEVHSLAQSDKDIAALLKERIDTYKNLGDKAMVDEEIVVGYLREAVNAAMNNRSFMQKLIDLFNRLLKSLNINTEVIEDAAGVNAMARIISDAIVQGTTISTRKPQNPFAQEAAMMSIRPERSSNYANMTEDGDGNFVFYHRSGAKFDKLDPKLVGKNTYTSGDEASAFSMAGGVSMFYSQPDRAEPQVKGKYNYMFKIPSEKVYDFNDDPENFISEARRRFKQAFPNGAFTPNHQVAFVTQVANENGYDIVVAKWNDKYGPRAHTTLELTPYDYAESSYNAVVKPFKEAHVSNRKKGWGVREGVSKQAALNNLYDRMQRSFPYGEYPELYRAIAARNTPIGMPDDATMAELVNNSEFISDDMKREYFFLQDIAEVKGMSVKEYDEFAGIEELKKNFEGWERLPEGHQSIFTLPDDRFAVTYDTTIDGEDVSKTMSFNNAAHFMGWLAQNMSEVQKVNGQDIPTFRNLTYEGKPIHVAPYNRIGDAKFSLMVKRAGGINSEQVSELLGVRLAKKVAGTRPTKRIVGEVFNKISRKLYGSVHQDPKKLLQSPRQMKKLALFLADELQWMIEESGKEGIPKSGYGWYSDYFDEAMDNLDRSGAIDLSTQDRRDFFTTLIAITSNQEKLYRNLEVSVALFNTLYNNYEETGGFDQDFLNRAEKKKFATKNTGKVIESIRIYENVIKHTGGVQQAKEFLLQKMDLNQAKKLINDNPELREVFMLGDRDIKTSFLADELIPLSGYIFGPKLGLFYANLSKQYEWLTMDRWWTRSFNRYRGSMLPNVSLNRLRAVLNDTDSKDSQLIKRSVALSKKYKDSGYRKDIFANEREANIAIAANNVRKAALEELNDAPRGGADRRVMMQVARLAVEEMQSRGYEFTVANVQEVIWFYEKYFYKELGVAGPAVADYADESVHVINKYKEDNSFFDASKVIVSSDQAKSRYINEETEGYTPDTDQIQEAAEISSSAVKGDTPQTRFSISPSRNKTENAEESIFYKGSRQVEIPSDATKYLSENALKGKKNSKNVAVGSKVSVSVDTDALHNGGVSLYNITDGRGNLSSQRVVNLNNVTFSYDSDAIEASRNAELPSKPMYNIDGEYVNVTGNESFSGIELEFNPLMDAGFVDGAGRTVASAEKVTITNGKVYASGKITYSDVPSSSDLFLDEEISVVTPQMTERFAEYMRLMGVNMTQEEASNYLSRMSVSNSTKFSRSRGNKMRRFAERMTEIAKNTPLKRKIEENPQNYYKPQSIEDIRNGLAYMSDAQLVSEMKQDALFTLFTGNDDVSVLAGIELLNRALDTGDYDAADTIVAQLSTMGTTAGRVLRHYAEVPSSTPSSMKNFIEQAVERAGKELTEAQKKKIDEVTRRFFETYREMQDIVDRLAEGENLESDLKTKQKEMEAVQRELDTVVNPLVEESWGNLLSTIMQGNLLTPISQVVNVTANVGTILLNVPLKLLTGATGSLLRAAGVQNDIPPVSFSAYYYAVMRGAYGVKEALHQIRTGQENADYEFRVSRGMMPIRSLMAGWTGDGLAMSPSKAAEINQRMKLLMKGTFGVPAEVMFRFLSLGDAPFKRFEEGLYTASIGKSMGLEGEALKRFVKFPPEQVQQAAAEEGRRVTFQNESRTYQMTTAVMEAVVNAAGGERAREAMRFMTRVVMPFRKTPANILEETLTFASPLLGLAKTSFAISRGDTKAAVEAFSKVVVGQMVYSAVDVLIANGLISLPIGLDEEERNLSYEMFPPSSINISGLRRLLNGEDASYQPTDIFARYDRIGTVGVLMGARAVSTPKELAEKNIKDRLGVNPVSSVFGLNELSTLSYMMDQSYLQGINGLLSMLSYRGPNQFERQVTDWFETSFRAVSAIPLPNTLSSMHRVGREYLPDYRSTSLMKRMENVILDRTFNYFGTAEQPPIRVDWKGEPIKQTPDGSYSFVYNLVDPFKSRTGSEDPIGLEALDIFNETGEVINVISIPQFARASVVRNLPEKSKMSSKQLYALKKANKRYRFLEEPKEDFAPELTAEESNRLVAIANKEKYKESLDLYQSNTYDRMSVQEKIDAYSKVNNRFNSALELNERARFRPHSLEFLDIIEQKYIERYGE